jgi:hypothetical protein
MIVFRCMKRLIARLRLPIAPDASGSTGRLGDWYANTLNAGPALRTLALGAHPAADHSSRAQGRVPRELS